MNAKAFVFTMDMIYGILAVMLLVSILVSLGSVPMSRSLYQYQVQARDKAFISILTEDLVGNDIDPLPAGNIGACDMAFRRTTDDWDNYFDPRNSLGWQVTQKCASD